MLFRSFVALSRRFVVFVRCFMNFDRRFDIFSRRFVASTIFYVAFDAATVLRRNVVGFLDQSFPR